YVGLTVSRPDVGDGARQLGPIGGQLRHRRSAALGGENDGRVGVGAERLHDAPGARARRFDQRLAAPPREPRPRVLDPHHPPPRAAAGRSRLAAWRTGWARMRGTAAMASARSRSSSHWRILVRVATRFSPRKSSSSAAKRRTLARLLPMRWMAIGTTNSAVS